MKKKVLKYGMLLLLICICFNIMPHNVKAASISKKSVEKKIVKLNKEINNLKSKIRKDKIGKKALIGKIVNTDPLIVKDTFSGNYYYITNKTSSGIFSSYIGYVKITGSRSYNVYQCIECIQSDVNSSNINQLSQKQKELEKCKNTIHGKFDMLKRIDGMVVGQYYTADACWDVKTTYNKIIWKSSNSKIATVSQRGYVRAKKPGKVKIIATASVSKRKRTLTITILPKAAVTFNSSKLTIEGIGNFIHASNIQYTLNPSNSPEKIKQWSSSNTSIIEYDSTDSTFIAKGYGTATITAEMTFGGIGTFTIEVVPAVDRTTIELNKAEIISYDLGEEIYIGSNLYAILNGNKDSKIVWSSSDKNVVDVNSQSLVTVGYGTATITATLSNGNSASCVIKVNKKTITLGETEITLNVSDFALPYSYFVTSISPETKYDNRIEWTSSDNSILSTNDAGGVFMIYKKGTVTVTASLGNGIEANCIVHIVE